MPRNVREVTPSALARAAGPHRSQGHGAPPWRAPFQGGARGRTRRARSAFSSVQAQAPLPQPLIGSAVASAAAVAGSAKPPRAGS